MEYTKLFLIALLMNAFSVFAEGGSAGNGGVIIDCGSKTTLADFYEVDILPGLRDKMQIVYSEDDVDVQVEKALKRLASVSSDSEATYVMLNKEYHRLKNSLVWLDGTFEWPFTDDLGRFPLQQGCSPKNVINYFSEKYADAQKGLFDELSFTEQAALFVHELIYKIIRKVSMENTSLTTRRITALLFSDNNDQDLLKGLYLKFMVKHPANTKIVIADDVSEMGLTLTYKNISGVMTMYLKKVVVNGREVSVNRKKHPYRTEIISLNKGVNQIGITTLYKGCNVPIDGVLNVDMGFQDLDMSFSGRMEQGYTYVENNIYILPERVTDYLYGRL